MSKLNKKLSKTNCKICNKEIKNVQTHLRQTHKFDLKEIEDYYLKYVSKKIKCLNCNNETDFMSIKAGYKNFCSECIKNKSHLSIYNRGYSENELKNILKKTSDSIKKNIKEKKNKGIYNESRKNCLEWWIKRGHTKEDYICYIENLMSNTRRNNEYYRNFEKERYENSYVRKIGYWIKKGYSEKQARIKVSKVQTRDLAFFIKKYGDIKGRKKHFEKIEKWIKNYKKRNYSKISQKLFWYLFKNFNEEERKFVYFAQLNENKEKNTSGHNFEKRIEIKNSFIMIDFIYKNKIIEFDGDYWHGKKRGNKKRDNDKDGEIKKLGYEILRIKENAYNKDKFKVFKKCIKFLCCIKRVKSKTITDIFKME